MMRLFKQRSFWAFLGSGLIVSVAYIDPGNWGTNVSGGSEFNYTLLWVIWLASAMAMLLQYLSGKLGLAGYSLPELIRMRWKSKRAIIIYWLLAEIAILATDLAEFLGIVVALNLLFGIPLIWGSVIAIIDIIFLLFITKNRYRLLEQFFMGFVSLIGLSFIYEVFIAKPNWSEVAMGSIVPHLSSATALVAVGIIGATVMPHALFLHSWLIKNKILNMGIKKGKSALHFHMFDTIASLTIAGFINAAMLVMAAAAFYQRGAVATLTEAYQTLIPLFGNLAAIVFALALLCAGISSSITATISGQAIMDGLTGFKISPWVRRILTRAINLVPIVVALLLGIEPLHILIYSQVVLSILIPLPLIPLIIYTANPKIMGELVNRRFTTILAWACAAIIVTFNAYLLWTFI